VNKQLWEVMEDNWRTYLNKNKRGSFVHVATCIGDHNGGDSGDEDMYDEEGTKHAIDLPDDDFDD